MRKRLRTTLWPRRAAAQFRRRHSFFADIIFWPTCIFIWVSEWDTSRHVYWPHKSVNDRILGRPTRRYVGRTFSHIPIGSLAMLPAHSDHCGGKLRLNGIIIDNLSQLKDNVRVCVCVFERGAAGPVHFSEDHHILIALIADAPYRRLSIVDTNKSRAGPPTTIFRSTFLMMQ